MNPLIRPMKATDFGPLRPLQEFSMNSRLLSAWKVGLLVVTSACASAGVAVEPEPTKNRPTGQISGRVLDGHGKPVPGANVRLLRFQLPEREWQSSKAAVVRTGPQGDYAFRQLRDGEFKVIAQADGFAKAFRGMILDHGQPLTVDVGLRKAARVAVLIRDDSGKPIVGARVRHLWERGANGDNYLRAADQEMFGIEFRASDKNGRLELPLLPAGSKLAVTIDHDDFAPTRLGDAVIQPGETYTAIMHRGVTLVFRFHPDDVAKRIGDVELNLHHAPFRHPSTVTTTRIPVRDGQARVTVEAGSYSVLWLKHDGYFITPIYDPDIVHGNYLRIASGKNDQFSCELHRKVVARGRVINDSTGEPVAHADVHGEIGMPAPLPAMKTFSGDWMHADWGTTDSSGRYLIHLAAGSARVSFAEPNSYTTDEYTNFIVASDGSTVIPDIRVRPMPKVSGQVVGADGRPIPQTVVRFRGKLEFIQPTLTDEKGRFEIQIPWLPREAGKRVLVHPLVAFHAYNPLGARIDVHLDRPETLSNVTLRLQPEPYERQLAEVAGDMSPWERGDLSNPELRRNARPELRGQPAPELECNSWVNTPRSKNRLADFQGRYVLLDFWTTGCAPCHADFPSVKLVHELYKNHGVTVIGVHDNSAPPDAIRKHVADQKLPFPIAIDTADGRTLHAYYDLGVEGFCSYLLLAPDGTIVHFDSRIPGPTLRSFKIEIVRAHVMAATRKAVARVAVPASHQ
jgi:thiol-disulfide isomerase/thioredoxin